jgi:serine/threonine-protein kinase
VCRVYDVGDVDGRHFLSMEFVDGEDLASLLRRIGRLPADKGVEIARQVCAGLAAAHDRGVLHRDLKPANIMIDGRGHARLADFGLAAAGAEVRAGEVAGTPAYMAPEQLEGQDLSTKTDIYALGLVLHELFTGKRVFDGASIQELRAQHRSRSGSGSRSALTSSAVDLDPAVDRVIGRCLLPDPRDRPASALAVAAALPGGDPLAAALAAGETPSPEMVAQAGTEGTLAPALAWILMTAVVLGTIATAWFASHQRIYRMLTAMRSPDVLAARAEDLLDAIGYGQLRVDRVYGLNRNFGAMGYVRERDPQRDRWQRAVAADVPIVRFWYRQSPGPLVPLDDVERAGPGDPPPTTPGMAHVELSPRGRLLVFRGVPPARRAADSTTTPDWSPLFKAAGVDPVTLSPVQPIRTPPDYADTLAAWEGRYPGRPEWTMRIEAASYGAQPIWFVVAGPWEQTPGPNAPQPTAPDVFVLVGQLTTVAIQFIALVCGALLALRNTRAGRADRQGALRVAICTGVSLLLSMIVGHHFAGSIAVMWQRLLTLVAIALFWSVVLWLNYLALEPFVRRRWPEAMVSWTRLLAGRFRDPLVGRDILVGCLAGLGILLLWDVMAMVPEWFGQPPGPPRGTNSIMRALGEVQLFASELLRRPARALLESMLMLFIILLAHAVLRNRWIATAAIMLAYGALALDRGDELQSALRTVILVGTLVTLVSRFGVLAYAAAWFIVFTILDLPLSIDSAGWYAARSAITAAMIVAVATWAFYRSLGGRAAFGTAFD